MIEQGGPAKVEAWLGRLSQVWCQVGPGSGRGNAWKQKQWRLESSSCLLLSLARRLCFVANREFFFSPFRSGKLSCGRLRRGGCDAMRCDAVLEWALQVEAVNQRKKAACLLETRWRDWRARRREKERDGREMMSEKLVEPMEMRSRAR